jgi:hypothetical protein
MNKTCVCLIAYKPNNIWINFLSKFTKYDVYIVIDDNSKDYKEQYSKFNNINIIQINDEECKKKGFVNMNFMIKKDITSWEKSIYYFSTINTKYNKVWFFEDDVFFNNEKTLLQIDSKYHNSDLLSNNYQENVTGDKDNWHWRKIDIKHSPPYFKAMACCVRISSSLLSNIKNYANKYNTLFFLEALFPTICKINKMKYDTPSEFRNIIYIKTYEDKEIDENNLFHPVKNITAHKYYREKMLNKNARISYRKIYLNIRTTY